MKVNNSVQPGWFFKDGQPYVALTQLPKTLKVTAQEVEKAVALGELSIARVGGCRIVALGEVFSWIEMKEES